MKTFGTRALFLFLIVFCALGVDMISKYLIHQHVSLTMWSAPIYPYGGIPVFENILGVDLTIAHVTNRGGPWGVVASHHSHLVFFRIFAIVCLIGHLLFFNEKKLREIPLCLVIAGAIGNVIDSFLYGHVIDMIHFVLWGYSFPVFNVADALICCGVAFLLIHACIEKYKENKSTSNEVSSSHYSDMYEQ